MRVKILMTVQLCATGFPKEKLLLMPN